MGSCEKGLDARFRTNPTTRPLLLIFTFTINGGNRALTVTVNVKIINGGMRIRPNRREIDDDDKCVGKLLFSRQHNTRAG